MGLRFRTQSLDTNPSGTSIKNSALSYAEADSNFAYLLTNMSGSSINLTGSTTITGNTTITGILNMIGGQQIFGTSSWAVNALTAGTSSYVPNLQEVLNSGNTGSNNILLRSELLPGITFAEVNIDPFGLIKAEAGPFLGGYRVEYGFIGQKFCHPSPRETSIATQISATSGSNILRLPETDGTFALSVNGNAADQNGNITVIGGSDTHIQYRSGSSFAGDSSFVYNYVSSSVAIGVSTAIGQYSFAHGNTNIAEGVSSQAHGRNTYAFGDRSHAEGDNTDALGINSHAEGAFTLASGSHSHAEGVRTQALKSGAHAAGFWTVADGRYQSVIGQYNISSSDDSAFIIGNGVDANNRRNLLFASGSQVQITGSLNVSGSITGSLQGTASWAESASWAPARAAGSNTQIQYNSGSSLAGDTAFIYNYVSRSLMLGPSSATAENSFAHGGNAIATGIYSHAEGANTVASGLRSHAEGNNTDAIGASSHAEGANTLASGSNSHAEGVSTQALKGGSHSAGFFTVADGTYQSVIGRYNISSSADAAFIIGNGADANNRSNLLFAAGNEVQITGSLRVTGSTYIVGLTSASQTNILTYDTASGQLYFTASSAIGGGGTPGGSNTEIQFNSGSVFSGSAAFRFVYSIQSLEQGQSVQAIGDYSHAEGINTTATGSHSHAEGLLTQAIGIASHAEGSGTTSTGIGSHAEGDSTIALGQTSHAEGLTTTAIGIGSHAEGSNTQAIGESSHAEGEETQAIGYASHAAGWSTIASGSYQSVIGQFNISSSADSAFIIGNGADVNNRSNLLFAAGNEVQITGSLNVSGSARITDVLTLPFQDPLPSGKPTGSIALSGSGGTYFGMFVYNGTSWVTA